MKTMLLTSMAVAATYVLAAVPLFDTESRRMHNVCGISAGILSQVCVAIINPWWLYTWTLWLAAFIWQTKDRPLREWRWAVFLAEIVCYVNMIGVLICPGA